MEIISSLSEVLPAEAIKTDDESLNTYGKDWTKHFTPKPSAIVFPKTTEEVRDLVLWARKSKTALVPSGGRTGLSAAAYATQGEVVVSFERMNKIIDFNATDKTIHCQGGVITEQLQNYAKDKGYMFPVDFASRGSSQIGGNIATNAGGIKVIRYGLIRNWVAGLTVVTGTGEILKLNNSLIKNASGYDLRHLFIGSEGTLGFITEAHLHVTKPPKDLSVFLFAVPTLDAIMKIYNEFTSRFDLVAFEMFTDLALKHVEAQGHIKSPLNEKSPYYILIELENENEDQLSQAMECFESCMENEWVIDGTLSQNHQQAIDIWRLREDISEATSMHDPYKNDISVKVSQVPHFLDEMDQILKKDYPDYEVVWFGHIGDGNLHINVLRPKDVSSEDFVEKCKIVNKALFEMIKKYNGSVSAEHGVGLTKKPFLNFTRSESEIHFMKEIKRAFDPDNIINPGKVFDL